MFTKSLPVFCLHSGGNATDSALPPPNPLVMKYEMKLAAWNCRYVLKAEFPVQ